jgi:diguanylate cyclase (GGDEF)-like protein
MQPIDMISAFVIGGVGALIGAGMMLVAMQGDRAQRAALAHCFWGFVVLGAGLAQNGFVDHARRWPILLGSVTALVGTLLISRGAIAIAHEARVPRGRLRAEAAVIMLALATAWPQGAYVFGLVFHGLSLLVGIGVAYGFRRALLAPRHAAEGAMAATLAVYALTWIYGLYSAAVYSGPELYHLMYMPEPMTTVYAVTYALMPLIVGSLILNLVNARLGERLRRQAHTDELTGLLSRRALLERAQRWRRGVHERGRAAGVVLVDVDHFKSINDTRGHDAGDEVLRALGLRMRGQLRRECLLGRWGGEELLALVDAPDLAEIAAVAERLRSVVGDRPFAFDGDSVAVTASIGVAAWTPQADFAQALARADAALYAAKRAGRDRVIVDGAPAPVSAPATASPGTPSPSAARSSN